MQDRPHQQPYFQTDQIALDALRAAAADAQDTIRRTHITISETRQLIRALDLMFERNYPPRRGPSTGARRRNAALIEGEIQY
jgi:hypothetical protein